MKLDSIHHVAIIVSDYERSRNFYVGLLGFEVIRENYRKERGDYKLDLKLGDCELEIFGHSGKPQKTQLSGSLRSAPPGLPCFRYG